MHYLVFDIGGSGNLRTGLWAPSTKEILDYQEYGSIMNTSQLCNVLHGLLKDNEDVSHIGGSIAGQFKRRGDGFPSNTILNSPNIKWIEDIDLGKAMRDITGNSGLVVRTDNDTVCSALGDAVLLPHLKRFYDCTVSSGDGGRQVIDGDVPNRDCEPGHQKFMFGPLAAPCGCGGRGCFESYLGGFLNGYRIRQAAAAAGVKIPPEANPWECLDERWKTKEEWAIRFYENYADILGAWWANVRMVYEIEAIVYKGGVLNHADWLIPMVRKAMIKHLGGYRAWAHKKNLAIIPSPEPENNSLIGAGRLIQINLEKVLASASPY